MRRRHPCPACARLSTRLCSRSMSALGIRPAAPSLQLEAEDSSLADAAGIVRVYNEGPVVGGVIAELISAGLFVIAVDDASTDSSADEIDRAGAFRVSHP